VVKINFDGDLIFSASSDKKINVWNSLSGELLGDFICKGASKTIDITKDTKYLFVASLNSIVECFDINTK
jgi:WD40 repeat protein